MIAAQNSLWIEEDEDEVPYIIEGDCGEYEENCMAEEARRPEDADGVIPMYGLQWRRRRCVWYPVMHDTNISL